MSETLRSVGLDVGTTSTQMILSELTIENRASSFSVPEMEISQRKILYRSPVHFTPLVDESHMDGQALRRIVEEEYRKAGITRETVDTGAVIITGETSRRENARTVLNALSELAGDFVVAAAGPDLESMLAAKGAGAVELSRKTTRPVLHMDIGGGTSNLALIRDGEIIQTGCLNVGGRLLKFDGSGCLRYVSPVLKGLFPFQIGDKPSVARIQELAQVLCQALEMAAGLLSPGPLLEQLETREAAHGWIPPEETPVLSFSGGVADCIGNEHEPFCFGDMGPVLGQAIRESRLCRGEYHLGGETIRATVIGAGCHSAQLSGSTVFHQNLKLPLKNLPVVKIREVSRMGQILGAQDTLAIAAMDGPECATYQQVTFLAQEIVKQCSGPILLCLERDLAKALGQALAVRLPRDTPILCIDRVRASDGCYLDIAQPVGGAFPVVVKTLILRK